MAQFPASIVVSSAELAHLKQVIGRLCDGYERTYLPDPGAEVVVDGLRVFYCESHRQRALLVQQAQVALEQIDRWVGRQAVRDASSGKVVALKKAEGSL